MKAISFNAIITSISVKKDKSLGLRVATPELTPDEKLAVMELQGINTKALIQPIDYVTDEVLEVKTEAGGKTPSQRLRASLYVLLKLRLGKDPSKYEWIKFYDETMEKFIQEVKNRMEQYE